MKKSKSDKNNFRSISNILFVDKNFRSKYDHSRTQKQNFEKFRDKNIQNSPFEMEIRIAHGIQMSLSPIYTFEIRISERICLKGDEKLFEL